ncbi:hypothetical protein ACJX0J_009441, partial [Zea mays]
LTNNGLVAPEKEGTKYLQLIGMFLSVLVVLALSGRLGFMHSHCFSLVYPILHANTEQRIGGRTTFYSLESDLLFDLIFSTGSDQAKHKSDLGPNPKKFFGTSLKIYIFNSLLITIGERGQNINIKEGDSVYHLLVFFDAF